MALTDWNWPNAHYPEVLVDMGSAGIERTITCETLAADFGQGYFATAVVGNTKFTRKWKLTWAPQRQDRWQLPPFVIPMNDDGSYAEAAYYGQAVTSTVNADGSISYFLAGAPMPADAMQPRLSYIQNFFQRRLKDGMPFVFIDVVERTTWNVSDPYNLAGQPKYLARIIQSNLDFTQSSDSPRRWSWDMTIQQVRPGYSSSQD
jgi:hypothetical protein